MSPISRPLRNVAPLAAAATALLLAGSATAASYFYPFTNATAGSTYHVGDSLTPSGSTVEFKQFQWFDGTWTATGVATVTLSAKAGGFANELNLNNINLRVIPDTPAVYATYKYAYFGGNVNLGVNGDLRNTNRPSDVDGDVVGGCDISVTEVPIPGSGGVRGEVDIDCPAGVVMDKFGVGGQEFFIDGVFFED
ncbi:MAG: hypothetical protein ACE37F_20660 [Nannocystaceae bacterium]|nr:hypothetical protein [bacterium]